MRSSAVYFAGLAGASALWAIGFGVSRFALNTFDPILFAFLRFSLSAVLLFALLKWKEGGVCVSRRAAIQLLLLGVIGVTGMESLLIVAIQWTSLANVSLLNVAPWPIFSALLAPLFVRETITRKLLVGGLFALVGVSCILLAGGAGVEFSARSMWGNLLALASSLLGAVFNLGCIPLMKTNSPLRVSAWTVLFGSLFMFPLTLGSWGSVHWVELGAADAAAIAYNVLFSTVAAFLIWNACMKRVGSSRANFFRYVLPAGASIIGFIWFGEPFGYWQLAGMLCMAVGLYWVGKDSQRSKEQLA